MTVIDSRVKTRIENSLAFAVAVADRVAALRTLCTSEAKWSQLQVYHDLSVTKLARVMKPVTQRIGTAVSESSHRLMMLGQEFGSRVNTISVWDSLESWSHQTDCCFNINR